MDLEEGRDRPPRAVIFDFDGVIADTEWLHCETFCGVLAEEGIHLSISDHEERFLGINDWAGFAKAFAEAGRTLSGDTLSSLVERKSASYSKRLGEVFPFTGVRDLVRGLARRCLLAIASGGRGVEIEAILQNHDLRHHFLALVSADEGGTLQALPGNLPRSARAPERSRAGARRRS